MEKKELPKAESERGGKSGKSVSTKCPYCGNIHFHRLYTNDNFIREADCFRGEYILSFSEED